jgi:hypothetical protein
LFLLHACELRAMAQQAGLHLEELILFTNSLTAGHVRLERLLHALPRGLVTSIEDLTNRAPSFVAERFCIELGARLRVA